MEYQRLMPSSEIRIDVNQRQGELVRVFLLVKTAPNFAATWPLGPALSWN